MSSFSRRCLRLRQLMRQHGLSTDDVAKLLDFHPLYAKHLWEGRREIQRRCLRLLELEMAERSRAQGSGPTIAA